MTHPFMQVGDRGQRFEVQINGYPNDGWNVIGWADNADVAKTMADSMMKAPGAKESKIIDRLAFPGRRNQ
jgi:hypothetical protein